MSPFPKKNVTRMYGSTLLALRGGGWGSNFQGKTVTEVVTLEIEWPLFGLYFLDILNINNINV